MSFSFFVPRLPRAAALAVLGLVALTQAACPGELENPERFGDCAPGAVESLFRAKCSTSGCHTGAEPAARLALDGADVGMSMVGKSSAADAPCTGRVLIDPADPTAAGSLLLDKLDGTPSCGSPMPLGTPTLPPSDLACIEAWARAAAEAAP